jgi:uncharacterized protein (TIGR03435 family)
MPLAAQAPPAQKPSFEVASIKPNISSDERVALLTPPGGRIVATNVTLKTLMAVAYRLPESRIFGGPSWLTTDRWNVEAKAEEGSIPDAARLPDPTVTPTLMLMTQSLIENRFQLKLHREMRELPVYELFVTKAGLKMKLSEDQGSTSAPTLPQEGRPTPRGFLKMGVSEIEANGIPFANFIAGLAQQLRRPVIDKTGLKGLYDIKLQWTPELGPTSSGPEQAPPPADSSGPSVFTALQEQLGLRLESAKGPVEVIVIDSVQKPSEN